MSDRKILYCASTDSHILNFHTPYLRFLRDEGFRIWVVANGEKEIPYATKVVRTRFTKKMTSFKNVEQIVLLYKVIKDNKFTVIHTHTTLASVVTRIALLLAGKKETRVINTTHGYFFRRNKMNVKELIFILAERVCAAVTDVVVTMNMEDFELAKHFRLAREEVVFINGMGVDINKFMKGSSAISKIDTRQRLDFGDKDFLLVYTAELSERKNHIELFEALRMIHHEIPNIKLLCAGDGVKEKDLLRYIKENKLENHIFLLGYCADMREIYAACDLAVSSSKCEGLPFNIIESMASGLPVVASSIKGHVDIITHEENGMLYKQGDSAELAKVICHVYRDSELREHIKQHIWDSIGKYSIDSVFDKNVEIYKSYK